MRGVITTVIAAALLGAIIGKTTAAMAAGYDGDWTVLVITERGDCDHTQSYNVRVSNGNVRYNGYTSVTVDGTVTPEGLVRVNIRHFDEGAAGSGRMTEHGGLGGWRGVGKSGACSGRWKAERR